MKFIKLIEKRFMLQSVFFVMIFQDTPEGYNFENELIFGSDGFG